MALRLHSANRKGESVVVGTVPVIPWRASAGRHEPEWKRGASEAAHENAW